jgi:hypothetical protein
VERIGLRLRFAWAFHAREVRFERARAGAPPAPLFPEIFSFHLEHHDPFELHLQLEDLWADPRRLGEGATRREVQEAVRRLLAALPDYLERVIDPLEAGGRLTGAASVRVHGDLVVLTRTLARFLAEKELAGLPELRLAALHLRKLAWCGLRALVDERVAPEAVAAWLAKRPIGAATAPEPSPRALLQALAAPPDPASDALLLELAARAFHEWLEDTCLDETNQAFEGEDSPFDPREDEVLAAAVIEPARRLRRTAHLSPFLRRLDSRDCQRLLRKLELWFLRQYDVHHAAVMRHHAESLRAGPVDPDRVLSRHGTRSYALALLLPSLPFLGAIFAYERAPRLFDALAAFEVGCVLAVVIWFIAYRFFWQRDVTLPRSVPRIGAGIIVGYLPVFLIDEVWDLAPSSRPGSSGRS